MSLALVGEVLRWLSVPLCFPLLVAVYYGETVVPFVVTIVICLIGGASLESLTEDRDLGPREAFLMVALTYFSVAVAGAIPFLVAGNGSIATPVNALFESMSGITTTGSTVLLDFDVHDRSIMMWRQMIQWLGGLGILILATAILSELRVGGAQLMETESRTQNVHRLRPHIAETARLIWQLYLGMTILAIGVLYALYLLGLAPSMTLFNAISHAFTSIATAGFSPEAQSVAAFTPIVQWAITFFMILGATNIILVYYVVEGDLRRPLRNDEFRFFLGLLALFATIVVVLLAQDVDYAGNLEATLRHAVFNVTSILTTTGYANADFEQWSVAAKHVLFICMFFGGMAGSTTCSIKMIRWLVVFKAFKRDLFTAIHPEAIRPVRVSGDPLDEETIRDIYAFVLASIVLFFVGAIVVVVDGARVGLELNEFEAMGAAAATFFNIGPAFGFAGPFGSFEGFPTTTKSVMIVMMWIGRIEIIPVVVLLTRSFWRS